MKKMKCCEFAPSTLLNVCAFSTSILMPIVECKLYYKEKAQSLSKMTKNEAQQPNPVTLAAATAAA
jgi:hypothetical protein